MPPNGYRESVCSHVSRILREERERQDLSMTRLAESAGLSQAMVSLIERELRNPSLETLLRLTAALGLDLSRVISRAEATAKTELGRRERKRSTK